MNYIILVLAGFLLASCATTSPKSMKSEDERFVVKPIVKSDFTKKPSDLNQVSPSNKNPIGVVIAAAGIIINVASKMLDNASKKFTADYENLASIDDFYTTGTLDLTYSGIFLSRFAKIEGKEKNVFNMKLKIIQSKDGSAFKFQPFFPNLSYSKCKVKADSIDILVKVVVESTWVGSDGNPHKEIMGNDEFLISGVKFIDDMDRDTNTNESPPMPVGHWIANIPRSRPDGRGNCTIKVTVIETDNFGKRSKAIAEFLSTNKDDITAIFDALKP
ncbi:hypothetical protein WBJ53_06205 [Spirosoma sp. SC4-14]|uniref:hypothetical protein n=1 Tax=Spirosoma sp. SC4-14 TaxID=3128900 RepID=UPI0030CF4444